MRFGRVTVTRLVIGVPELVMNALAPFSTHCPPPAPSRNSARVSVAKASEPPPGSVRPNADSARPATRSGSQRSFWASLP